jgi:hypothetical protein
VILVLVPGVVAAHADASAAELLRVDLEVLRAVVAGELEARRLRPQVLADGGIRGRRDGHPDSEARLGALAVVGVPAALADTQAIDRARDERRLAEVRDAAACPGSRGMNLK